MLCLADPVCSILRLHVYSGIPIHIEDDDSSARLQIQTQSTGSRGEQKHIHFLHIHTYHDIYALCSSMSMYVCTVTTIAAYRSLIEFVNELFPVF